MAPDKRFASNAAVFSITRTVTRLKWGAGPYQVGLGSRITCEPDTTSVIR